MEKTGRTSRAGSGVRRLASAAADSVMCALMNGVQWSLRHLACSAEELEEYLLRCGAMGRKEFFSAPFPEGAKIVGGNRLVWPTPAASGYPENDTARAEVFWSARGASAPTVFLLHALMSAHPAGYRRLAARFNAAGWNAVFPHLPFHYSRVPAGHRNGALAMTANLVRNGEALRQAVGEILQVKAWFAARGCKEFGVVGTSYGGWVGALAASVEDGWSFLALVQPIADVERAIWDNPAAKSIRRILCGRGIGRGAASRHAHLSSPKHGVPLLDASRIVLCGGEFDRVSPTEELREMAGLWGAPEILEVPQGHFGYEALPATAAKVFSLIRGA